MFFFQSHHLLCYIINHRIIVIIMSKKSYRFGRTHLMGKKQSPSILRKKRKYDDNESGGSVSEDDSRTSEASFSQLYNEERLLSAHPLLKSSPFPEVSWGDSDEIWNSLLERESSYPRDHTLFNRHPELQPKMRAILLDWLIEVCEVYKLHRETFYLGQDLIDRFLAKKENARKDYLQLIGITCLFIAAKIEEIYPPKLSEFAYVTDGACTEREILQQEIIILVCVEWNVTPVTISIWLSTFLQIAAYRENNDKNFEVCSFDGEVFGQLCQLLDLCILDINSLQFSYGILAASAVIHLISEEVGLSVSGFKKSDVAECVEWMIPFVETVSEYEKAQPKYFEDVLDCDMHNIQTHEIGLKLLEQVHFKQSVQESHKKMKDELVEMGILTPPQSNKKLCIRRDKP